MQLFSGVACNSCLHLGEIDEDPLAEVVCAAFPKGIPDAILTGENDHSKPYPGDNGIRYEPIRDNW